MYLHKNGRKWKARCYLLLKMSKSLLIKARVQVRSVRSMKTMKICNSRKFRLERLKKAKSQILVINVKIKDSHPKVRKMTKR